jgi:ATP synthase protein I
MPQPVDEEALRRLDQRADALEARTARPTSALAEKASSDGYRVLAELLGGIFGGLGLGWLLDQAAGTAPWGMVGGLLIGLVGSIFLVVRTAGRMSAKAGAPAPSVPFDDEDDADR